jgi:hypothetical protein
LVFLLFYSVFPPCCLKKPNQLISGRVGLSDDFHGYAFLQTVFNVRREKTDAARHIHGHVSMWSTFK